MAETPPTLNITYDDYNDVLRASKVRGPVDSIAVPSGDVTLLVAPEGDQVLGLVFERYLPIVRRGAPEGLSDADLLRYSIGLVENIVPPMFEGLGPSAKDRVAEWTALVDECFVEVLTKFKKVPDEEGPSR